MVLADEGTVVIADISRHPAVIGPPAMLRLLNASFVAGAPVRSSGGKILGVLTIFAEQPRPGMTPEEVHMLERLAEMVSTQLELRHLRSAFSHQGLPRPRTAKPHTVAPSWPRCSDFRNALERHEFLLYYQPEVDLNTHMIVGVEALFAGTTQNAA